MRNELLNLLKNYGGSVTFAEVMRIPGARGDRAFGSTTFKNCLLWDGLSEELIGALKQMFADGEIEYVPASPLVYLFDGEVLQLPIAKRSRSYKEPHWVPVCIRLTKAKKKREAA